MPLDDTDLRIRSGNWKSKSASAAYEGTCLKATQRDAVLSRRVVGATSLSLVLETGPKFGRVKVFLDGVLLTSVSLKGAKGFAKVVPLATFSTGERQADHPGEQEEAGPDRRPCGGDRPVTPVVVHRDHFPRGPR